MHPHAQGVARIFRFTRGERCRFNPDRFEAASAIAEHDLGTDIALVGWDIDMQVAVTTAGGAPGGQEHRGAVALVTPAQLNGQQETFLRNGDGGDGAVSGRRAVVLGQADPAAEDVRSAGDKGLAGLAIMTDLGADAPFIRFRYGDCRCGEAVVGCGAG